MTKEKRTRSILFFSVLAIVFLIAALFTGSEGGEEESIQVTMRDSVLHEVNRISLLGLIDVNPAMISGFIVSGILILFALIVRIFFIPKFTYVPGKLQLILETLVNLFDNMAKQSSKINKFLGAYIFAAGVYIFTGTIFELFGVQAVTTVGRSISLPAPLADINGAIMMGCLSYLVIMSGGVAGNGIKGIGKTLKEYSLPISLSFRLFGALLSGALVTELVYYYNALSYGIPIIVGVMFTLLHALIQAYVLTMLTSMFYGQVSDNTPKPKKEKKVKEKKSKEKKSEKQIENISKLSEEM